MIEHKSRQNKKRKCLKIDNLLKKNRIEKLTKLESKLTDDFVKCEWQIEMDDVSQKIYYSNEKSGETNWSIDATKEDFQQSNPMN